MIAIKKSHEGLLHREKGVPEGKPIPASDLKMPAGHSVNALKLKRQIVFAKNAKKWNHSK
jgi:hypothetical protein